MRAGRAWGCLPNGSTGTTGGDEPIGINALPTSTDISLFSTTGFNTIYIPTNGTLIDWDQNGDVTGVHVSQDINGDGATTLLTGYNDWQSLKFNYQCSSNYDPTSQAAAKFPFEQLFQEYWLAAAHAEPAGSGASNTMPQIVGRPNAAPRGNNHDFLWRIDHHLF